MTRFDHVIQRVSAVVMRVVTYEQALLQDFDVSGRRRSDTMRQSGYCDQGRMKVRGAREVSLGKMRKVEN